MKIKNLFVFPLGLGWAVMFEGKKDFEMITSDKDEAVNYAEKLSTINDANIFIYDTEKRLEEIYYNWEKYTNREYGFSVQYRDDFSPNEAYVYYLGSSDMSYKGVSFGIPTLFVTGTNLSADTFISIEILPLDKGCLPKNYISALIGYEFKEENRIINGKNFNYTEYEESAMGNIYEEKLYTYSGKKGICYGIRLFLHSHRYELYDSKEVKRFDRQSIMNIYERMIKSFSSETKQDDAEQVLINYIRRVKSGMNIEVLKRYDDEKDWIFDIKYQTKKEYHKKTKRIDKKTGEVE